jgi:hypothetical protein
VRATLDAVFRHSMRAYYLPILAGGALAVSAFLPWIFVGETPFGGVPDVAGLWILGLGLLAMTLAGASIATRRNSRHPLLVVGLTALGIMFLAWRLMSRAAEERAWAMAQARAIVEGGRAPLLPSPTVGSGIYLGLTASLVLVLFGLTIVVKKVKKPYAEEEDD